MKDNLEIKKIPISEEAKKIIGYHSSGGIVVIDDRFYWLRHPQFRWNGSSWGWENNGFSKSDISEVGYLLTPPDKKLTTELVKENLTKLKEGVLPQAFTIGTEIEGCLYDESGNLIPKHDSQIKIEEDKHPELLNFIVETSTKPINDRYLSTPLEIAHGLAEAVLEGYEISQGRAGKIVYSSVPEAGNFYQAQITPHPYLLSFAPKVLDFTLRNWDKIPQQAKEIYDEKLGINIFDYFQQTNLLNWPVNALHVHNGIPEIEGLADPRIAYAYGILRQTELAKIFSFLLYNTSYLYCVNTGLKDVRSIIRRILTTTINSNLPSDSQSLINGMIEELTIGKIHSPSRYPATGQHDRVRFRAEAQYKTIESIDAPMAPDLRLVLGWVFFNQILNVIALDAIYQTQGDESMVIDYLKKRQGSIFQVLPTIGENSSFSYDLIFNQSGLDGRINGKSFREKLLEIKRIIEYHGNLYPAVHPQSEIVSRLIDLALAPQNPDLVSFLGIENGIFTPNDKNTGLMTDAKSGLTPHELITIQSEATQKQAEQLLHVSNLSDLLSYFGL